MKQGKYINQVLLFILLVLSSCVSEQSELDMHGQNDGLFKLELQSNFISDLSTKKIIDDTRLFLFKNDGSLFEHEILNLNKSDQSISCKIKEGNWSLSIVSFENNHLIQSANKELSASKSTLYEYRPRINDNNKSSDAEEIFTSFVKLPQITKDVNTQVSASIARNVSKIEINLNNIIGDIDLNSSDNFVYLHEVPAKISYDGNLLPNAITPDTLRSPLQAPLNIIQDGNKLYADKISFVIPGNKADILGENVITHKMMLSVQLKKKDGTIYKSHKEIPLPAKCNEILLLNVAVNAGLDISAVIHPWIEENHDIAISQGNLIVSKTKVEMSNTDNVFVQSNSPFILDIGHTDDWLQVIKTSDSQIHLKADVESYSGNRVTRFYIETNRVRKEITVEQRPEKNTISVSPKRLILSPVHPSKEFNLTSDGTWKLQNQLSKVLISQTSGSAGLNKIRIDRHDRNYGDESCTIRNINSLEDVHVELSNLFMTAPEVIEFGGNGGTQIIPIDCFGGRAFANVSTTTDFIEVSLTPDNEVKVTVQASPIEMSRRGSIVISHADDPEYKIEIPVIQKENIIVTIPEFEYLTYRYFWTSSDGRDLDTGTELINTGLIDRSSGQSVDNAPVGWSMKGNNITDVKNYLKWGGDNTQSGNECTFIDMEALLSAQNYPLLPRFIEARIYAAWYGEKRNGNITFEIVAYKGGRMIKDGYNFVNQGGVEVYKETHHKYIPAKGGSNNAASYKTNYTYVCKIIYDKIKHSAQVEIIPDAPRSKAYYFKGDLKK